MRYCEFGTTGLKVSKLSFGAMRLPTLSKPYDPGSGAVDYDETTRVIHLAMEMGINFFDSMYLYHHGNSEVALGKALKGCREQVIIQTKASYYLKQEYKAGESHRTRLEKTLKRLDTEYIDFYLMHSLSDDRLGEYGEEWLEMAMKAKDEGLIRFIGFSSHDKPENVRKLIDTAEFSAIVLQYSLIDRRYENVIAYAHERGLGTAIMGPVAGGRLAKPSEELMKLIPGEVAGTAEAALRFVLANPNVDTAMSGMNTIEMIEDNVAVANRDEPLSDEEFRQIQKILDEKQKLADLYCTGCRYCMPCPNKVAIAPIFQYMNLHRLYGLTEHAREHYAGLGGGNTENQNAAACTECGECEEKCPQNIPIQEQLKQAHETLG